MDNLDQGIWQYKLSNNNEWQNFEFIDEQLDECDYILLDDNDRIRFVPNSNVYSADENYPSIVFYAWDQSLQNNSGSCVNFSEQENNSRFNQNSGVVHIDREEIILDQFLMLFYYFLSHLFYSQ